jgi:mono/diheme cytochrome c family protein
MFRAANIWAFFPIFCRTPNPRARLRPFPEESAMNPKTCKQLVTQGLLATSMVALAACGGGGGGGGDVETATLTGTVTESVSAASVQASSVSSPVTVTAVDENGNVADAESDVTGTFSLTVPTGHDYVVIVSDDNGIIGAMVYGADDRPDFTVEPGTVSLSLGDLTVDREHRSVHSDNGDGEVHGSTQPLIDATADNDGDHIPDSVDTDDDNDGIEDSLDVSGTRDRSMDHDNDGIDDSTDTNDDNDTLDDSSDDHPMDFDNDGEDDDRDRNDDETNSDHPRYMDTTSGDAATGGEIFAVHCAGCHGDDGSGGAGESIRGESTREIAEALSEGEEEGDMPAFPDLVDSAADIAAFLNSSTTGGTTGGDTGGTTLDGAALFTSSCGGCHTGNGLGSGSFRDVTGATTQQISSAIASVGMMSGLASLTTDQIAAIAAVL